MGSSVMQSLPDAMLSSDEDMQRMLVPDQSRQTHWCEDGCMKASWTTSMDLRSLCKMAQLRKLCHG